MDRKKLVLLLAALVVAIGTALMARSMFSGGASPKATAAVVAPEPTGPKVLVAQRALPIGTIITPDAIGYQPWPKDMVDNAYFIEGDSDLNKMLGTVVRQTVTAGEPITRGALVAPGDRGFLAAALGPGRAPAETGSSLSRPPARANRSGGSASRRPRARSFPRRLRVSRAGRKRVRLLRVSNGDPSRAPCLTVLNPNASLLRVVTFW